MSTNPLATKLENIINSNDVSLAIYILKTPENFKTEVVNDARNQTRQHKGFSNIIEQAVDNIPKRFKSANPFMRPASKFKM